MGLKAGGRVSLDREGEYVIRLTGAQEEVNAGRLGEARAKAEELKAEFPDTSGPLTLDCAIELTQRHAAAAKQRCSKAVEIDAQDATAHYLLATACRQLGERLASIEHLRAVIDLDARRADAYHLLAMQYRASGNDLALPALEARYRREFNRSLP
jgi:predicted Zn-dependent protease